MKKHALFMERNGYKHLILRLHTIGNYSKKDSEWNYSDIPHLNYIHTKVEGFSFYSDNERIVNLFMQRFGPFTIPVTNYIEHTKSDYHFYVMNILGMVVAVKTSHEEKGDLKALTITEYKFYYRSFIEKLFAFAIKFATKKNYKVLMSEDVPMRNQRGFLRKKGFKFFSDKNKLIGFTETEDLTITNVNSRNYFEKKDSINIDLNFKGNYLNINDWFLTIFVMDKNVSVMANICQHEGANVTYDFGTEHNQCKASCPWHGKRITPLLVLNKNDKNPHIFKYMNQEFGAQINKNKLKISVKVNKS